ncbi:hypothetical protein [Sphingorhabdus sp.]|uniref:hypothetical protein n=1 Tax=Sphingorhabdus sp. TaxID=1902408 RepID=UPI003D819CEA
MLKFSVIGLIIAAGAGTAHADSQAAWEDPFQGARFNSLPAKTKPLTSADCNGDVYNKCTFEVMIDFDSDNLPDRAYMANAGRNGIIVVDFGNKRKKPLVVGSFRDRFQGDNYIAKDTDDRRNIVFIHPEASAATYRMISGKPRVRWNSD